MGLSERKQKQKVGVDPRNLGWSQDHSRFSFQYLSKLGWDPSKGLGTDHEGNPTHVKVARKLDASGIGRERAIKEGKEGNGPVGEGLENVLKRLRAKVGGPIVFNNDDDNEESGDVKQEEEDVKVKVEDDDEAGSGASTPVAAARVINASRAKYLKSKRLAASSPAAMAEILGFGANTPLGGGSSGANTPVNGIGFPHVDTPAPGSPNVKLEGDEEEERSPSPVEDTPKEDPYQTFVSPLSVNEYFRQRLAQRQAQREGRAVPELITDRSKLPGTAEVAKEFEGKKVTFGEDGEVRSITEPKKSTSTTGEVKTEEAVAAAGNSASAAESSSSSSSSRRKDKKRSSSKETEEERTARKAAEKAAKKAAKLQAKSSRTEADGDQKQQRRKDKGKAKAASGDLDVSDAAAAVSQAATTTSLAAKEDKKDKKKKRKEAGDGAEVESAAAASSEKSSSSKKRRKSEGAEEDSKRKKSKKDK